jgi:glycosyltransferase involved in cell wall biosynthesis
MTFRFHVVGLPHTSVTQAFTACAFTERVRKFCGMMHGLGHEVFLYAGPESDACVSEHIPCISEDERAAAVGDRHFVHASFDNSLPHWRAFNARAIAGIKARAQPRDFICIIGGLAHKPIADALPDMMTVEFSIGYGGNFAKYRVWESYAWMHTCYGAQGGNPNAIDGRWFDAVIPGSFDPDDFPFRAEKDDYHLFIGRLTERKGFQIAIDVCKRLGKRLVIAGQADEIPADCEYAGVVGPHERGRLMAGAQAVWVPTIYIEPFGNVAVEAQLCGTPVITTDWGAMTETVVDGVTGWRCRTFGEFRNAAMIASHGLTDAAAIRDRAVKRYSTKAIAVKYHKHFTRLASLWGDGWYDIPTAAPLQQ